MYTISQHPTRNNIMISRISLVACRSIQKILSTDNYMLPRICFMSRQEVWMINVYEQLYTTTNESHEQTNYITIQLLIADNYMLLRTILMGNQNILIIKPRILQYSSWKPYKGLYSETKLLILYVLLMLGHFIKFSSKR